MLVPRHLVIERVEKYPVLAYEFHDRFVLREVVAVYVCECQWGQPWDS